MWRTCFPLVSVVLLKRVTYVPPRHRIFDRIPATPVDDTRGETPAFKISNTAGASVDTEDSAGPSTVPPSPPAGGPAIQNDRSLLVAYQAQGNARGISSLTVAIDDEVAAEILSVSISAGADVRATDQGFAGRTPLFAAVSSDRADLIHESTPLRVDLIVLLLCQANRTEKYVHVGHSAKKKHSTPYSPHQRWA